MVQNDWPVELIPLELLDAPVLPMRLTFDPDAIQQLAESLKRNGQIQPILVEPENGRYRIHVGHRRFLAAIAGGLQVLRAVVAPPGQAISEALKAHENTFRADVNPAEQAIYFTRLCEEQCGSDVDKLCELLNLRRPYVEERMLLLTGDAQVLEALHRGELTLGAARELNRYSDEPLRRVRLDAAVRGGATVRQIREWRVADEQLLKIIAGDDDHAAPGPSPAAHAVQDLMVCIFCHCSERKYDMELMYAHRTCQGLAEQGVQFPPAPARRPAE